MILIWLQFFRVRHPHRSGRLLSIALWRCDCGQDRYERHLDRHGSAGHGDLSARTGDRRLGGYRGRQPEHRHGRRAGELRLQSVHYHDPGLPSSQGIGLYACQSRPYPGGGIWRYSDRLCRFQPADGGRNRRIFHRTCGSLYAHHRAVLCHCHAHRVSL